VPSTITTAASWGFDMALPIELRLEVEELLHAYGAVLDDGNLDAWPEFFTEDCFYQVIPRDNHERGLPLALIRCESKGMLKDRVYAIRETMMYEPRYLRHLISGIRVTGEDARGMTVEANYAVFETPLNDLTRVFNVGRYIDRIVREYGRLKFAEKHCVFDSLLVPNSIIFPV
jgi:salicylate 5-hydroxylase small subunit